MREKTLKPWHGAAFFLLIMIVFFAICVPLQSHFGLYGVAATEIILLILALLFAKVMGYSLRSLFPVHSPGRTANVRNYSDVDFVLYPCNGRFTDPVSLISRRNGDNQQRD